MPRAASACRWLDAAGCWSMFNFMQAGRHSSLRDHAKLTPELQSRRLVVDDDDDDGSLVEAAAPKLKISDESLLHGRYPVSSPSPPRKRSHVTSPNAHDRPSRFSPSPPRDTQSSPGAQSSPLRNLRWCRRRMTSMCALGSIALGALASLAFEARVQQLSTVDSPTDVPHGQITSDGQRRPSAVEALINASNGQATTGVPAKPAVTTRMAAVHARQRWHSPASRTPR